jgi:hypothetical protein
MLDADSISFTSASLGVDLKAGAPITAWTPRAASTSSSPTGISRAGSLWET